MSPSVSERLCQQGRLLSALGVGKVKGWEKLDYIPCKKRTHWNWVVVLQIENKKGHIIC